MITRDDVTFMMQRGMAYAHNLETMAQSEEYTRNQLEALVTRELSRALESEGLGTARRFDYATLELGKILSEMVSIPDMLGYCERLAAAYGKLVEIIEDRAIEAALAVVYPNMDSLDDTRRAIRDKIASMQGEAR